MFILMGVALAESGVARAIFGSVQRMMSWLPGGLAVATVAACTLFGGVSGSSAADAATIGRVSIKEMSSRGYPARFSAALVAAAGTVAVLIPPSVILIMYGILTGESIGKLLIAGIIPGILMGLLFMAYVVIWAMKRGPRLAAARPVTEPAAVAGERLPAGEVTPSSEPGAGTVGDGDPARAGEVAGYVGLAFAGILFVVVLGGIYTGVFTATEASAFGALVALLMSVYLLRSGWGRHFLASLKETASVTGMIFAILLGGSIFTFFLVSAGVPRALTQWVLALDVPPLVIVIGFLALLLPLGMFLDGLSMLVIVVPLAYPTVTALGFDGIWFGVLVVVMVEVSLLTPPVGLNVYVIAGLPGSPKAGPIFASVTPFILIQFALLAVLIAFPSIVTWLPDLART